MECDYSQVSNNSVYGKNQFGFYIATRRTPATGFSFTDNVSLGRSSLYPKRIDLALFPFWPNRDSSHSDVRIADLSDSARYTFSDNVLGSTHKSVCDRWASSCPFVKMGSADIEDYWSHLRSPEQLDYRDRRRSHRGFHYLDERGGTSHSIPTHLLPYGSDSLDALLSRAQSP